MTKAKHIFLIGSLALGVFSLSLVEAEEPLSFGETVKLVSLPPLNTKPNYDKLCRAIAVAETSDCTQGTARSRKNCHGIMSWDEKGNRFPRKFQSHQESHNACVSLWKRKYKTFPDLGLAKKWTGHDNAKRWLEIVTVKYHSL